VTRRPDDENALQLDLYLDRILAGDAVLEDGWLSGPADEGVARAAVSVADGATRFHPSFRFEERLARRLRDIAVGLDRMPAAGGVLVPFGPAVATTRARSRHLGGVLVGSAIASGVSIASLAGAAAIVAWRRARWERLV
jgi:hypothetical protein